MERMNCLINNGEGRQGWKKLPEPTCGTHSLTHMQDTHLKERETKLKIVQEDHILNHCKCQAQKFQRSSVDKRCRYKNVFGPSFGSKT